METANYIVGRIEQILKDKHYSRYKLAKTSELSQASVTNLLNRRNMPSIPTLEKICNGLGLTLAQFFSYENKRPNLTEEQTKHLDQWDSLTAREKELVSAFMKGVIANR